jgi:hypothetical protein
MAESLTRRDAVKRLGKLGAMSALAMSPLARVASAAPPCRPFSIVLHGMFLLDVFNDNEKYIRISTAYYAGHKYLAGPWSPDIKEYATVSNYHEEPLWDSHIQVLTSTGGMPILKTTVGDPDHNKAYLSFRAPYPTTIRLMRSFDESEVNYPRCCIEASQFPLVLALEYDYLPNFPPINGTKLDRNRNYHVFAESLERMDCTKAIAHGKEAIGEFWKMLPNAPIPPNSYVLPKDEKKCFKGIDGSGWPCNNPKEEAGLSELPALANGAALDSLHLPLCANFIVP